jgi:hypothetical protein
VTHDPQHPRLADVLAGPHRDSWRLSAHHTDLPNGRLDLELVRAQVSWDDNRTPRCELRADVIPPTATEWDALLDPRTGIRLHLHLGHYLRRGTPSSRPGRVNRCINPSVNVNANAWGLGTGAATWSTSRQTDGYAQGFPAAAYMRGTVTAGGASASTGWIVGTPSADYVVVTGGAVHTLSAYARSSVAGHTVGITASWHDSSGVQVGGFTTGPQFAVDGPNPVRVSHTLTVPAGATRGYVRFYVGAGKAPWTVGSTMELGACLVEQGGELTGYFDGSTPDVNPEYGGSTYAWSSGVGASSSVETVWTAAELIVEDQLVADLGLRLRGTVTPSGTTALDAQSDEALVLDAAPSSVLSSLVEASTTAAITTAVQTAVPGATVLVGSGVPAGSAVNVPAGSYLDKWATVEDLSDQLGDVTVYDPGDRVFRIELQPALAGVGDEDLVMVEGAGGTVVARDSQVDRDPWFNRVVLVYRWTVAGTENVIQSVRSLTTGPFSTTSAPVKAYREERNQPASQARADVAAASIVRRKASLGRGLRVRAVAVPWLRPGHTASMTTRTGQARHLAAAVTLDSAGWMEFTTRYPDSTETIGA